MELIPVASKALGPLQTAQTQAPGEIPYGPPLLWVAGWHPGTCSFRPFCTGTPQPGTGHPCSSLACSVMQFLHKSTRQRKKQNNERSPGLTPAVRHSGYIGKVGPTDPCSYAMACAGVPVPLATHRHDAGSSMGHCSTSAPGPTRDGAFLCHAGTEPGEIHCPHPGCTGQLWAETRPPAEHQAPCHRDLCLNSSNLRTVRSGTLNVTRSQTVINASRARCLHA